MDQLHKPTEDERQRRIGRLVAGKEIVDVVGWYATPSAAKRWLVVAHCPFCGKPFKVKELSLYSKAVNCGCRPRANGVALRESGNLTISGERCSVAEGERRREEAIKAAAVRRHDKAEQDGPLYVPENPSLKKWYGRDAMDRFTKDRVLAYWMTLDHTACCPAWQDFEKFYGWAIRNGYSREKVLVRLDPTKLMSPLTCKWSLP